MCFVLFFTIVAYDLNSSTYSLDLRYLNIDYNFPCVVMQSYVFHIYVITRYMNYESEHKRAINEAKRVGLNWYIIP